MTVKEIADMLKETGYPVAYGYFTNENAPKTMPYVAYAVTSESGFYADNEVYTPFGTVEVELYTAKKDLEAEKKLKEAFVRHGISYQKIGENWIEKRVFSSFYEFEEVITDE